MVEALIARARAEGRVVLGEIESKQLVAARGIQVVPTGLATSREQAAALARELGLPAVVKLVSPGVSHKSDVDGVRLALADEAAVAAAFDELRERAAASVGFDGVAVQPMAPPGLELLLGAHRDPDFGPVVSFGLGGVMVELLAEVALRVAPVSEADAAEMVDETRAGRLLAGFRGRPPIPRGPVEQALVRLSELMIATPAVSEIDLNPVLAYSTGILAVDARVVLVDPTDTHPASSSAPE